MDILQLIDRLEELFNESKTIPLTRNVMVDEDRMLDIIDQMRIAIPEEVKKAQQLLGQRDRVLAQAQEEANRTLEIARQKADQLVAKDMVAAGSPAPRRPDPGAGARRSGNIRADADDYVIDSLTPAPGGIGAHPEPGPERHPHGAGGTGAAGCGLLHV